MPDLSIRPARPDDLDALAHLWDAFMREQAALDARATPSDDAPARGRTTLRDAIGSPHALVLVAERAGEPIGFVAGHTRAPSPVYAGSVEAQLTELYVAPPERRQGLAGRLMRAAIAWARERGLSRVRFDVLWANAPSRAVWDRSGYAPVSLTYAVELDPPDAPSERAPMGFQV
jgi:GNAT superfamily N-acetyltransferase